MSSKVVHGWVIIIFYLAKFNYEYSASWEMFLNNLWLYFWRKKTWWPWVNLNDLQILVNYMIHCHVNELVLKQYSIVAYSNFQ